MDKVTGFDEENSDSDYMNVSSSDESSDENEYQAKRRNLTINKRKDVLDITKIPTTKLNIKQSIPQTGVKISLKRKFTIGSGAASSVKKENDGGGSNFQIISAPQSPHEVSLASPMDVDLLSSPTFLMPAPGQQQQQSIEEPPYFPEKFGGKLCAFCNLGERSQLGQGEMLRLEVTEDILNSISSLNEENQKSDDPCKILKNSSGPNSSTLLQQQLNRRQKGLNKCKNPIITTEYVDELERIGYQEAIDFSMLIENGFYYVHRACALWSFGVTRDPISDALSSNISQILKNSLSKKCSYCNRYGASARCQINSQRFYHYPCIAASGSFQVFQNCSLYSPEHLNQVSLTCKFNFINF